MMMMMMMMMMMLMMMMMMSRHREAAGHHTKVGSAALHMSDKNSAANQVGHHSFPTSASLCEKQHASSV
jgi:hypothetical protein